MIRRFTHTMYLMLGVAISLLLIAATFMDTGGDGTKGKSKTSICGVNFVAPPSPITADRIGAVKEVNANYVSIIPYAFQKPGQTFVKFNYAGQWWGESITGATAQVKFAHEQGLKVMLKPHVWVWGQGWAGDFRLKTEPEWKEWETNYETYILTYAKVAAEEKVEMLCIGTEFRKVVEDRPQFFGQLADKVRKVYSGKVVYAANWDNYEKVKFWNKLDYIGIDAYFPLTQAETPSVKELLTKWEPTCSDLQNLSNKVGKQILFTEYGYLSVNKGCGKNWELEANLRAQTLNMQAQQNGFEALYKTYWDHDWFAGGFLWVWHANGSVGGDRDRNYTPQNKPVCSVIKQWYGRTNP